MAMDEVETHSFQSPGEQTLEESRLADAQKVQRLIDLIEKDDHQAIERLLEERQFAPEAHIEYTFPNLVDEEQVPSQGDVTPLMIASYNGCHEIVKLLLNRVSSLKSQPQVEDLPEGKPEIDGRDNMGNNALHLASSQGHGEIIKTLLEAGIDINSINWCGKTALFMASRRGQAAAVKLLLESRADGEITDMDGHLPIHEATWWDHLECVKILAEKFPHHLNKKNSYGNTCAINAPQIGSFQITQYLVEKGADYTVAANSGMTGLHHACSRDGDHLDIVKLLIPRSGENWLKRRNNDGSTPLHLACWAGNHLIFQYLLANGADIHAISSSNQDNALHPASWGGNLEIVRTLSDMGVDVHARNDDNRSPLLIACHGGHLLIVKFLIEEKAADLNARDCDGNTTLHAAIFGDNSALKKSHAQKCALEIVQYLLPLNNNLLEARDNDGRTPLHLACWAGNHSIVQYLLANGADIHAISSSNQDNVLHPASWGGNLEIVRTLSDEGIDVHEKNGDNRSPLLIACHGGHLPIIKFLIEEKAADPSALDCDGNTILHAAIFGDNSALEKSHAQKCALEIVQYLLPLNNNLLEARNNDGRTPLLVACHAGNSAVAKYLVKQDADLNAVDDANKDTALHLAASGGNVATCRALLLKNEKLLNMTNGDNGTPLLVAGSSMNFEVVTFLIDKYGPALKINVVDSEGETILHKVSPTNLTDNIQWLLGQGADITKNKIGRNPLHVACYAKNVDSATLLLDSLVKGQDKGARIMDAITAKDDWDETPLKDAAARGHSVTVLNLLKHAAYFPELLDVPDSNTPQFYFSDPEECRTVLQLLSTWLESLEETPNKDSSETSEADARASIRETDEVENLKAACFWAVLNGQLELVKACVARAMKIGSDFSQQTERKAWPNILAAGRFASEKWVNKETWNPFLGVKDLQSPEVQTILFQLAIENANLNLVRQILNQPRPGTSPTCLDMILHRIRDGDGREVPLISLAASGVTVAHYDMHRLLWKKIEEEAERTKIFSNFSKDSPKSHASRILELAAQFGEESTLKGFMRGISQKESTGDTNVLALAIRLQYPRLVFWLLSNGTYQNEKYIRKGFETLESMPQHSTSASYLKIEQILKAPPVLTKHGRRSDDHLPPVLEHEPGEYESFPEATVVEFSYSKEDGYAISRMQPRPLDKILSYETIQHTMLCVQYDHLFPEEEKAQPSGSSPSAPRRVERGQRGKGPSQPIKQQAPEPSAKKDVKEKLPIKDMPLVKEHAVRWIHVPANDMDCFEKLMTKIHIDKDEKRGYHRSLRYFLRKSWSRLPAGGQKGYMKPQYLKRPVPENKSTQDNKDADEKPRFSESALYIPFVSWTTQHSIPKSVPKITNNASSPQASPELPNQGNEEFPKLNINQGYMTLDQYYYASLVDTRERDKDQVLGRILGKLAPEMKESRNLAGGIPDKNHQQCTALIVNQLWLWIIDSKTILTSSTQRTTDDRDSFFDCALESLKESFKDRHMGESIESIVGPILSTVVGSFERRDINLHPSRGHKSSLLDAYRDSISNMRDKEAHLFKAFSKSLNPEISPAQPQINHAAEPQTGLKKWCQRIMSLRGSKGISRQGPSEEPENSRGASVPQTQGQNSISPSDIPKSTEVSDKPSEESQEDGNDQCQDHSFGNIAKETELLREVKDIRDELNILKNLAEDQEDVWNQFWGQGKPGSQYFNYSSPSEVKFEIKEMMKEAASVQEDFHILLDLKQKQANIEEARNARLQSEETRKQSETIMIFTVVTILFLPATFLTGLFALNVNEFPHEGGTVAYKGSWIFPIIIFVSLGTSAIFSLLAFNPNWLSISNKESHNRRRNKDQEENEDNERFNRSAASVINRRRIWREFGRKKKDLRGDIAV